MINALRGSSRKKYEIYLKQWQIFCDNRKIDTVTVVDVVNFLSELFDKGLSYSSIKAAKSALGQVVVIAPYKTLGDHPMIMKFMKGVYNLNPPKTKLGFVWDVKNLFDYFEKMPSYEAITDVDLSCKTLLLLLLLGGQRINTIFNFRVDEMIINNVSVTFAPSSTLKHSRQNRKGDIFEYRSYQNPKLCVVSALKAYLARRNNRVSNSIKELFITYKKPYRPASIDTLRRWVKNTLNKAGIFNFSAHSCRSAATSKAKLMNVDLEEILRKACWSNVRTFEKHYKKNIVSMEELNSFHKILE